MLEQSRTYNDYDYCLVHLLPEYEQYKDFFFESVKQGRHTLLDNSIFELGQAYDSEKFAQWVVDLNPTEYIVPDNLEDAEKTINSFKTFTQNFGNLPGKKIGVVQGKTFDELKECYKFMSEHADKIAISFDYSYYNDNCNGVEFLTNHLIGNTHNKWVNLAKGRIEFLLRLYREGLLVNKPHHLLGCSVPWEFKVIRHIEPINSYIDTIDTSNPIVAGILNNMYDESFGLNEKWSFKLVDFINTNLTSAQQTVALQNVETFRTFCA
jgi:hypothetical protein